MVRISSQRNVFTITGWMDPSNMFQPSTNWRWSYFLPKTTMVSCIHFKQITKFRPIWILVNLLSRFISTSIHTRAMWKGPHFIYFLFFIFLCRNFLDISPCYHHCRVSRLESNITFQGSRKWVPPIQIKRRNIKNPLKMRGEPTYHTIYHLLSVNSLLVSLYEKYLTKASWGW